MSTTVQLVQYDTASISFECSDMYSHLLGVFFCIFSLFMQMSIRHSTQPPISHNIHITHSTRYVPMKFQSFESCLFYFFLLLLVFKHVIMHFCSSFLCYYSLYAKYMNRIYDGAFIAYVACIIIIIFFLHSVH